MAGERLFLLAVGPVLFAGGCLGDYQPAPRPASQPKTNPTATSPAALPPTSSEAPRPSVQAPPTSVAAPSGPTVKAAPAPGFPVRLSAGVALPQTLPEGTMMGFSVDYRFVQGQPLSSTPYYWVILRAQGTPARIPVRLNAQGNLAKFLSWRPEEGPFQARFEDAGANPVSGTIDLKPP
jgi:hypothetical protein